MRVGADAVGPDQGPGGSGVDRRLISEEPMVWSCVAFALPLNSFHFGRLKSIVFNLAMSCMFSYPPHLMSQFQTLAVQRIGNQSI
jgi:hypothetical protein